MDIATETEVEVEVEVAVLITKIDTEDKEAGGTRMEAEDDLIALY